MTSLEKGIQAAKDEREHLLNDVEKFKDSYARELLSHQDEMLEYLDNPEIAKEEKKKYKRRLFFTRLKKALGIS